MRRGCVAAVALIALSGAAGAANADPGIRIGPYSDQVDPGRAVVGAKITSSVERKGRGSQSNATMAVAVTLTTAPKTRSVSDQPTYPTLSSTSQLFQDATPFGQGTFWYGGGGNVDCIYQAGSNPPCYRITGAAQGAAGAAVNPAGIAAAVAGRLELSAGVLHASPTAQGVTGSDSWFWLDPEPRERALSTSLAGETVRVTATPTVSWQFGDGSTFTGGAGVPYQPGPPPPDAVVHLFQTRCLPGDRGRNPYVLASCASDGYQLRAMVSWQIGYSASGPVDTSGVLPARTTETSVAYPVSEVRGFLVEGETP